MIIAIRREDKSIWERRTPLIPQDVKELIGKGLKFVVQPSPIRIFHDREFEEAGAELNTDLSGADIILGIKEIPPAKLIPEKVYMFFSHTIKGQPYNMEMLRKLLDLKTTLIDYEKITNEKGRRLIFFGTFAGYAGAIDTLWAIGQRMKEEGIDTPFSRLKPSHEYYSLKEAKEEIKAVGNEIKERGLNCSSLPFVIGFGGYGNVSKGAQEIIDLLPVKEVQPEGISNINPDAKIIYKVVFKEWHMVEPKEGKFDLQDYYRNPRKYRGVFKKYLPYLTVFINAIYWEEKYPRLITKEDLKELYYGEAKLKVIGDISCDIEGAVEATVKSTEPADPVFLYDVESGTPIHKLTGKGPLILAVDILPSQIPRESSIYFSNVLKGFIPEIAKADFLAPFENLDLPSEIKRAVIVHKGQLTPDYKYLKKFIKGVES